MSVLGYIVKSDRFDDPLILLTRSTAAWKDVPKGGILLREDKTVTAFPTRAAARRAITRTKTYFAAHPCPSGSPREHEDYQIARLVSP